MLNVPIVHSVECRSSLYDVRRILPFNLYHCLLQGHRRLPIVPGMVKGIDLPLVWCCKLYNWYPWVPGKKVTLGEGTVDVGPSLLLPSTCRDIPTLLPSRHPSIPNKTITHSCPWTCHQPVATARGAATRQVWGDHYNTTGDCFVPDRFCCPHMTRFTP